MPSAITNGARIRTNTPAENAYNSLNAANKDIATRQLRLSTGKRVNAASDDVSGYITARALQARNGSLKAALMSVGDAQNVASIAQDGLANINDLVTQIKDAAATASSGALGTDEKISLAKGAYRLAQQIQTVVNSTVFSGKELLNSNFSGDFIIGYNTNTMLTLALDLTTSNSDFNVTGQFDLKALTAGSSGTVAGFAGVTNLNMLALNSVTSSDLGIFSNTAINVTLTSLTSALNNVNKVASYLGGVMNRLNSQEEGLKSQITNYSAAISRIEDADVATEQLQLVRAQFLQQASLTSLGQANQAPQQFLQLFR